MNAKQTLLSAIDAAIEAALREYAEGWQDERILYEDRWAEFIGPDGHMRPELTCDMHHPNREGAMVYMDKYNV